jgi:hypothetical protein
MQVRCMQRVPHIYGLKYQNSMHILLIQIVNFFNLIKCKFLQLNKQGILPSFRTSGNYCSTCGFLIVPKHMIGKIC